MAWFEPLIIIGAISFVGLVIFLHFYLKKKGKSLSGGCTGKCSGNCSSCHACSSKKEMLKKYRKMCSENENAL